MNLDPSSDLLPAANVDAAESSRLQHVREVWASRFRFQLRRPRSGSLTQLHNPRSLTPVIVRGLNRRATISRNSTVTPMV